MKRFAIPISPADGWSQGSGSISVFYEDAGGLRIVSIRLNGFPGAAKNPGLPEEETRTPVPESPAREILLRLENAVREHFSHGKAEYGPFFPYLNPSANEKEIRVVDILKKSRPGDIMSYSTLSQKAGLGKNAARYVGSLMRKNPYPLLIPCHRVVTVTGERYFTGQGVFSLPEILPRVGHYGGGKPLKAYLLHKEHSFMRR